MTALYGEEEPEKGGIKTAREVPEQVGRYRILSELGRGSMGCVFLALDPNIDRKVALKVLEPLRDVSAQEEAELQGRFVLEARAAGRLKNSGIVTVYDAEIDPESGRSFIAMEWVDGPSLEKLIQESGPLPSSQAIAIAEQVAVALDSAHREGLVHRDIKPANILLDQSGQAKISDFGIAKFTSMSHTVAGRILGSPYYMSPEQIRNEDLDGRSDLFSLGIVLYQAVTAVVPFDGDSMASITYKILEIDPKPPQSINPAVTVALAEVIERALEKSPAGRFRTGSEFAQALRAVDTGSARAVPHGQETGTVLLPAAGPTSEGSPERAVGRTGRLGELVEVAIAQGRRFWGSLTGRPRMSLAVLAVFSALLLLMIFRPWKSEPVAQAVQTRPGEASGQSMPAQEVKGTERPAAEVVEPPVPADEPLALEPAAKQSPVPSGWATLDVSYKNRLRSAFLTIWIDGEKTWSQRVTAPKGLLKRASGTGVRANIMVPEGGHVIEVRIDGSEGKVRAAKRIEANFEEGQTRRLGVSLIPPNLLKVSWKD